MGRLSIYQKAELGILKLTNIVSIRCSHLSMASCTMFVLKSAPCLVCATVYAAMRRKCNYRGALPACKEQEEEEHVLELGLQPQSVAVMTVHFHICRLLLTSACSMSRCMVSQSMGKPASQQHALA